PTRRGARGSLFDPSRIAINALDARAVRQDPNEQLTPMPNTAPNVEHIAHAIERKPFGHQLKEVDIPPIVAGVTEILGRMGLQSAKFVGHQDSRAMPVNLVRAICEYHDARETTKAALHKKLCGSTSTSSLILPFGFGADASHCRR